jgi:hypothetical protein
VWAMALGEEVFIKTEEFFPECLGKRIFYFLKKNIFFPECYTRGRVFLKKNKTLPQVLHSGKRIFKKNGGQHRRR